MKNRTRLIRSVTLLLVAAIAGACTSTSTPTPTEPPIELPTEAPTEAPTPTPAGPSLGDTWARPTDEMAMFFVPGDTFQMGSPETDSLASDPEFPQHSVTLDGFWVDSTEVTNGQYDRCVESGACQPSGDAGDEERTGPEYPVETVSWHNAATYCEWAGGRLPTEAEWEYAARGPDGMLYPWGNEPPTTELCNFDNNIIGTTAAGSFPSGASWCGALDLAGNVAEWVADWYDEGYYATSPSQNPLGPETGEYRVLRGGSWGHGEAGVRSTDRSYVLPPDHIYGGVGFRCVTDLE